MSNQQNKNLIHIAHYCAEGDTLNSSESSLLFLILQMVENINENLPILICVYSGIVLLNLILHCVQELPTELLYKKKVRDICQATL